MNEEYNEKEFEKAFQEAAELEQQKIRQETELAYSQYLAQDQQYHSYHSELAEYEKTLQTDYDYDDDDDDDDYYESERKRREQEDDDYWEEQQRQQDDAEFDAFCEYYDRLEEDYSIAEKEALGLY